MLLDSSFSSSMISSFMQFNHTDCKVKLFSSRAPVSVIPLLLNPASGTLHTRPALWGYGAAPPLKTAGPTLFFAVVRVFTNHPPLQRRAPPSASGTADPPHLICVIFFFNVILISHVYIAYKTA